MATIMETIGILEAPPAESPWLKDLNDLTVAVEDHFAFVRKKHNIEGEFSCPYFRAIHAIIRRIRGK